MNKYTVLAAISSLFFSSYLAASEKPELTVYTYDSFTAEWGPGPHLKKGFESQCNCTLKFISLESSATILNRLKLEGEQSSADVVIGLDTNLMESAQQSGLFETSSVDTQALKLPIDWNSKTFIPFDYGYFSFIYDENKLSNPPTSLKALVEGPESEKIIVIDPRTSTPGLGLMLWVKHVYGDDAPEAWVKLSKKILTITKGWSEAYFSLFLNGEAPMVISYSTSPAYHIAIDKVENYRAASFDEGHYLQVEIAGVLKKSQHKSLANDLLQYVISPAFQQHIPLSNVMYPVVDLGDKLPAAFGQLITPKKTLMFTPEKVAEQRKTWTNEWLDAVSQ